ncbi:MAG: hypothetical protein H7246_16900 [Phycisphaerae bacterium]|nr:hypothetical protein [Saprospiraceae bacterium]
MFKLLAFLILFQTSIFAAAPSVEPSFCSCPSVPNLQKTGQTTNSFTYGWTTAYSGAQYRVWYIRQEDGYNSGFIYTNSLSYSFTGLSAGHYTFYFQTMCEQEASSVIGIEDTVVA